MMSPKIVVLTGPTASGKSALALSLARNLPLEVVNADSMQVYRHMDIGTAKPSESERAWIPHHLIDVADPDEPYNAGRYVSDAERAVADIVARGKVPLVVGGTGMYIRALLRGLDPLPADPEVRRLLGCRWVEEGAAALHAELARIDPETAAKVHPSDRVRVVRALEIAALAGVPASRVRGRWCAARGRYRTLFLALWPEREALYARIAARTEGMFRGGLLSEVQDLLGRGYGRDLKPMGGLGYRQAVRHLLDRLPLPDAIESTRRETCRYAKRQFTWLSSEPEQVRLSPDRALRDAGKSVKLFLSEP